MALDRFTDPRVRNDGLDDLLPGTDLCQGKYRVTRTLSNGGFGITYLATDRDGQTVVVKECFATDLCRRSGNRVKARSLAAQPLLDKVIRSFLNEARTLRMLSHPNIVGISNVFEDNGTAYMVLDFICGQDLHDVIDTETPPLTAEDIQAISRKLIVAIGYVHDHGVVHCDLSPDNIFLDRALEPVLIDFGAARSAQAAGPRKPYTGLSMVKDGYSPHEQYLPDAKIGPSTDLYALGASLYHLISGEAPAPCQLRIAALADRKPDPCRPLAGRIPGYPAAFLASIDKAMSVMSHARFQSAQDWLAAMDARPTSGGRDWSTAIVRKVMSFAAL
jgi:hypothetical protein